MEIDHDAIAANVAALRSHARAPRLMAVVKADGYGHGLVEAARSAVAGGADELAVALVEEGEALRAAGVDVPILLLTEPPAAAIGALLTARLTPTVYSPGFVTALQEAAAAREGPPAAVHLKLDTGMRRVGVPPADWEDALRRVRDAGALHLAGLWSHFAVADEPDHPFIAEQADAFARGLELARALDAAPDVAHLANSAATLDLPDTHHDLVRPGLAVYGLEPAPGLAGEVPLRPALALRARLSLVKRLTEGEAVSYGLTWAPDRDTCLGTVPAGYADGVVRALGNRARALVGGRRVPYAGRVCMDQFCVDLGPDATEADGDEVTLIGGQGDERVSVDEWAGLLGTINYEIITRIGPRVPRVHLGAAGES
ncbi:alanine racemase [Egibacter rhizosphaerae]|uniref:Alanine racemase n=1 Tax=Egibacter rhizosphaerae TaxID=1670831 RepID=A0A411YLG4_9ACTN|nr:alanine racemase [Egibacter rhizosphaerae]